MYKYNSFEDKQDMVTDRAYRLKVCVVSGVPRQLSILLSRRGAGASAVQRVAEPSGSLGHIRGSGWLVGGAYRWVVATVLRCPTRVAVVLT